MKENRKENVVLANYKVESEAYQALSELKRDTANANYTISQAMIVKRDSDVKNFVKQKSFTVDLDCGELSVC